MILKKETKRKNTFFTNILWAIPLLLIFFLFTQLPQSETTPIGVLSDTLVVDKVVFECDLEEDNGKFYLAGDYTLEGLDYRTEDHAYSGKYSIALNSQNIFGLTTWFHPPSHDATYHLSVRRYNPNEVDSYLVVAAPNSKQLYRAVKEGKPDVPSDEKWEVLELLFQIPPDVDSVKIYCYVSENANGSTYFDDLALRIQDIQSVGRQYNIEALKLQIEEEGLNRLKQKRSDAWSKGLLIKEEDDWVKTKLTYNQNEMKGRLRLKGDWLDHLRGDKWSFRIKLKDPNSLWGMITFNLQKPDTRNHLSEWIYHKMLSGEGLLSPKYEFVTLALNEKNLGFYAIEEHFEKELVESQARREGPIFKFSEERMWRGLQRSFEDYGKNLFPLENDKENAFKSSPIEAFSAEDYYGNPDLLGHYRRGLELMTKYKHNSVPLDQIFNVDILGKYLAIIDLSGAYHNLTWHNQRWYYNPITDLLEPIGFDGFATTAPKLSPGVTILAEEAYESEKDKYEPYKRFFENREIVSSYVQYLDSFSKKIYLDSFFETHHAQIEAYTKGLEEEYLGDVFNRQNYYERSAEIRLTIPAYSESVQFFRINDNELYILNHHVLPIVLSENIKSGSANSLILPVKSGEKGVTLRLNAPRNVVRFHVLGMDNFVESPVKETMDLVQKVDLQPSKIPDLHPLLKKENTHYVLNSGTSRVPIIVPDKATLLVPGGVHLNLLSKAYLHTSGNVLMGGDEENMIRIYSEDGTGALSVQMAEDMSTLEYVIFDHLGRVDHNGHTLTGGVTFYESDVELYHCAFINNTEEDALNTVRSTFYLENCIFENTAFDAFDSDFCTGKIKDCFFKNTGNDAVDFSGSEVQIISCEMQGIGDKGVSVGEHSNVRVHYAKIERANIGLASKDLSTLTIDFVELLNVGTGFTAYQKKASFGPATIIVKDYIAKRVPRLHLIERNSTLQTGNDPVL